MGMSLFPKMLKFKQKDIPYPQLFRWSEWFSKYSFDVKHIKEKTNVLVNILSRPFENFMIKPSSSKFKSLIFFFFYILPSKFSSRTSSRSVESNHGKKIPQRGQKYDVFLPT
ncbi:hypothetical protein Gotur_019831 [Gossypium turneri]